jgi:hypothetical protein
MKTVSDVENTKVKDLVEQLTAVDQESYVGFKINLKEMKDLIGSNVAEDEELGFVILKADGVERSNTSDIISIVVNVVA